MRTKQTKLPKVAWNIWNISVWIIVLALALLTFALVGVRIFGITPYTLLSGSMEPTLRTGSLVYSVKVEPEDLETGDIITWKISPGSTEAQSIYCTHRIVSIDNTAKTVQTKGDANPTPDSKALAQSEIKGKVVFSIPYLGSFESFIHSTLGSYLSFGISALLILYIFAPLLLSRAGSSDGDDDYRHRVDSAYTRYLKELKRKENKK